MPLPDPRFDPRRYQDILDAAERFASKGVELFFGDDCPLISATKSLTGHSLGAAGVHEAIYSLLMMREGFLAASANVDNLDPECELRGLVLKEPREKQAVDYILNNSFGMLGINSVVIVRKL